jgi:hypothetical protein
MRHAKVIDPSGMNYPGFVLDLPGCIATGATIAHFMLKRCVRRAIRFRRPQVT